jgi:uncharacterized membrane protein YwaF
MSLFDLFFVDNTGFKSFDQSHLIVLGLFAGSIVAMVAAKNSSVAAKARATHALAYLTAGTVVVWTLLRLATGKFTPSVDMPFDICNMTAIVWLPLLTFAPKRGWGAGVRQVLFDGMLFTAFPGTIQAFFTPHLYDAFPHITWLKFWIVHGGIIVGVLAAGILDGMRTSRPLWRGHCALSPVHDRLDRLLVCHERAARRQLYLLALSAADRLGARLLRTVAALLPCLAAGGLSGVCDQPLRVSRL